MSKGKVFIIVRFSILSREQRGTVTAHSAASKDDYKSALFQKSRLSEKLATFKNITLASLLSAESQDKDVHLIILTSDVLPQEVHKELTESLKALEPTNITHSICYVDSGITPKLHTGKLFSNHHEAISFVMTEMLQGEYQNSKVASVRLDDDDGVSKSFFKRVSDYMDFSERPFVLSFSYGYQGLYDYKEQTVKELKHFYSPKLALGLVYISKVSDAIKSNGKVTSIYSLGRHTRLDEKIPVLSLADKPMWFRTIAEHNDSGDKPMLENMFSVSKSNFKASDFDFLTEKLSILFSEVKESSNWAPTRSTMEKAIIKGLRKKLVKNG